MYVLNDMLSVDTLTTILFDKAAISTLANAIELGFTVVVVPEIRVRGEPIKIKAF